MKGRKMRLIAILFSVFFAHGVMAETLYFGCEGTYRSVAGDMREFQENYAVDMTNKTWETRYRISDDVLVSPSQISVKDIWVDGGTTNPMESTDTMRISRIDLSFRRELSIKYIGFIKKNLPTEVYSGQCEIVPKLERAF
tara:strand:- start:203 stop:622 length:420 start_codon:yes stop_codon:yes gene_type:complete